jgi:uncharacterized protein YjbI with pentapeptide repeats
VGLQPYEEGALTEHARIALIERIATARREWRWANSELVHLEKGVSAWNQWRSRQAESRPDLSGIDLSGVDLCGVDLSDAKLIRANLAGADLSGANLSRADLGQANLSRANLQDAILVDADLIWAKLVETNLRRADMRRSKPIEADFIGSDLSEAILSDAKLSRASFMDAVLCRTDFSRSKLIEANFSDAILAQCSFVDTILIGADLWRAKLVGSDLTRAALTGVKLNNADLTRANLSSADLSDVKARGTRFAGATLTGACVQGWDIDIETHFGDVVCDYIYLTKGDRCPEGTRTFGPGEFEQAVRNELFAIEWGFPEGIDWTAFVEAFETVDSANPDLQLALQSFEQRSDRSLIVRLDAAGASDRTTVAQQLRAAYGKALAEQRKKTSSRHAEDQAERHRHHYTQLLAIAQAAAKIQKQSS